MWDRGPDVSQTPKAKMESSCLHTAHPFLQRPDQEKQVPPLQLQQAVPRG